MLKWQEVSLDDVSEERSYGYTASATASRVGPKFLRITDIVPDRIDWKKVPYCSIPTNKLPKYLLDRGDIVIARTGATTGYNKALDGSHTPAVFASYLIRFRIDPAVARWQYVQYVLQSKQWFRFVENVKGGSAQPGANATQLGSFKFLLPPENDQIAIAHTLSLLDAKIDLLRQQNETLEAMGAAVFREWFVEGEEHAEGYLKDELTFVMGSSPPGSSYNEEGVGLPMYQGNKDFGFRFPTNRIFTTEPKRLAKKHDTLISVRAPVGAQNMANEKCCIGRGVAAFRYRSDPTLSSYTYYKMMSLIKRLEQYNNNGTVFGAISKRDFNNFTTEIPPIEKARMFDRTVGKLDEKIFTNRQGINCLQALRDFLLPKLMSGEVTIRP